MPWNGSGTYVRDNGTYTGNSVWQADRDDPAIAGQIKADRHDTHDQDLADGITKAIAKDGQNAATADLPMGGFKHTNVADATALTNYASAKQVQNGSLMWGGTATGSANAFAITCTPSVAAYTAGQRFLFISNQAINGASTLAVNGLAAKSITKDGTTALVTTDIYNGQVVAVVYDGTQFQLQTAHVTPYVYADPLTTRGDVLVRNSSNVTARLAVGAASTILASDGTDTTFRTRAALNIARLDDANLFTKGQNVTPEAMSDGATITPDFAVSNYHTVTLGGNRTLANPSNLVAGQTGVFVITQDGTGSRTLAFGTFYKFAGGSKTLSTAAGTVDLISYCAISTSLIYCTLLKAFS